VYRAYQQWLGRTAELTPMWHAWERGDRKAAVAAVPEQVIGQLLLRGTMADIRAHVDRYLAAGIDTAFLQLSTLESDRTRSRRVLLDALRALAPANR
jgi:alkanesulfonate monooxygenase SsuD/methylene tetrahydromethanopterin reductase-like flavin-dependent oxidoreductase (luciferase family)